MKKYCSVCAVLAVLLVSVAPVFSDTSDSASLNLSGFIEALPDLVTLEIEQTEAEQQLTQNMDLTVARYGGEEDSLGTLKSTRQGTVTFSVHAESANNFRLAHTEDTAALFPYTLQVNDGSDFTAGDGMGLLKANINSDAWETGLRISHDAADLNLFPAGTYTDTITFTVQTGS